MLFPWGWQLYSLACAPQCLWKQTGNYGNQTPAPSYMSGGLSWQQPHWTWWPLTVVESSRVSRESLGTSHFGSFCSRLCYYFTFLLQSLFISVSTAALTEGSSEECEPARTKYNPQTLTATADSKVVSLLTELLKLVPRLCILSADEYKDRSPVNQSLST